MASDLSFATFAKLNLNFRHYRSDANQQQHLYSTTWWKTKLDFKQPTMIDSTPSNSNRLIPDSARVAVIGAGAAGLQAARQLQAAAYQTTVFEATNYVGGLWRYTTIPSSTSAIYRSLRTNIPKQAMAFERDTYPPHAPTFLPHHLVYQYLQRYSEEHNLLPLISFNSAVTSIEKQSNQWLVTTAATSDLFDAVFVCVGHFSKPRLWEVDGFRHLADNGISTLHSMEYRTPDNYTNKRILLVGFGPSGVDIGMEICDFASDVYVSHVSHSKSYVVDGCMSNKPNNLTEVGRVERVLSDGTLLLPDGNHLRVDSVVTCTGYRRHYPFLKQGEAGVTLTLDDRNIIGLVRHCVAIEDASMTFIGILQRSIPFPTFEEQVAFSIAVLEGTVDTKTFARLVEEERYTRVDDKYYHALGGRQWEYIRELAQLAGRPATRESLIELCKYSSKERKRDLRKFRECELVLLGEESGMWERVSAEPS